MAGIVLFWAPFLALIFFLLNIAFNSIVSIFESLIDILSYILTGVIILVVDFILAELIHEAIEAYVNGHIMSFIFGMAFVVLLLVCIWKIIGTLGVILFGLIVLAVEYLVGGIDIGLNFAAGKCGQAHNYFLQKIIDNVQK